MFKGCIGRAGHLGHISLNPDGPLDIVGTPGSLEDTIGNSTVKTRSNGRFTSTRQLVDAHLKGDKDATEVWMRSLRSLAAGLTSIINAIDPEVIILGGGIAQAGPALFEPVSGFMNRIEWKPKGHEVKIIPAALGVPTALATAPHQPSKAEADIGRDVGIHSQQLAQGSPPLTTAPHYLSAGRFL